jgi:hypothetical protein
MVFVITIAALFGLEYLGREQAPKIVEQPVSLPTPKMSAAKQDAK